MKKKILALLVFTCMLIPSFSKIKAHELEISGITSVHIHETKEEQETPRIALCGRCGNGTIYTNKSYGAWIDTKGQTSKCLHGKPRGTDAIFERSVTTTHTCTYCGDVNVSLRTERKYECHGYY